MKSDLYSARIGESCSIGEQKTYDDLLHGIMEFTIRAALARSIDESDWEHEELRRKGLAALQIVRNGKAVWACRESFGAELAEARREHDARFERSNELDPALYDRLDGDLRAYWRRAGYDTPSLAYDMKKLFAELERDAADRAAGARESLLTELLKNE
jgi:hypothetical protein